MTVFDVRLVLFLEWPNTSSDKVIMTTITDEIVSTFRIDEITLGKAALQSILHREQATLLIPREARPI